MSSIQVSQDNVSNGSLDGHSGRERQQQALSELCQAYWQPLYLFARRRVGNVNDAQDLTQAFFAELLEKDLVRVASPQRGRFRSFLLTAFKNFISHQREKASAEKRGGRQSILSLDFESADETFRIDPATSVTPDQEYDRRWAIHLIDQVMQQLESEFEDETQLFAELKAFLLADSDRMRYAELAQAHGKSVGGLKMMTHRLRARYRELLRAAIADTVAAEDQIDDEIRWLFSALQGTQRG
ncbi:RNA polymerase sigma factor [Stieleria maiorica]|uniref:RNA polymerase sigma factor n=1 Tax=Stieleria maiorica TaxID=2795974 RepID=UPI0011CBC798|nr:sigma-70 family RNA polymerase sigma factor [Stieleria maiorica]